MVLNKIVVSKIVNSRVPEVDKVPKDFSVNFRVLLSIKIPLYLFCFFFSRKRAPDMVRTFLGGSMIQVSLLEGEREIVSSQS